MAGSSKGEDARKEMSRANECFGAGNCQPGLMVSPHYFTQHLYYPYVNPYSHLTEPNGALAIHGYGTDGRPKFRRSRTIFSPEQLDILEEHFTKYKYPDVKRRRAIADEVGLPEERVQVWFQNRRAKNKRQTDQQVKLERLVSEAISTNHDNGQQELEKLQRNSGQAGISASVQNAHECQRSPFGGTYLQDTNNENGENRIFHGMIPRNPRLQELEVGNRQGSFGETIFPEAPRMPHDQNRLENSAASQTVWPQHLSGETSSFGSAEAQVVLQNIDQDLLLKVANILSASNDAASLISEWSQTPNKTRTDNLEEQLRHFAEHHQQVLKDSELAVNQDTPASNETPDQDSRDKTRDES